MEIQELITIIQAAQISGKSIQTIRRMIKQKKIRVRKQKTPQGFNYLIVKESIVDFLNDTRSKTFFSDTNSVESFSFPQQQTTPKKTSESEELMSNPHVTMIHQANQQPTQMDDREHRSITQDALEEFRNEVGKFNMTIQKLIEQHQNDKSNFFDLIKTFQDRVIILENQIKLLEAPKASWWQFWK